MSGDTSMRQIVDIASTLFTDEGVAIFLGARTTVFGQRPIDLCRTAEGRRRVWEYLEATAHGVFS